MSKRNIQISDLPSSVANAGSVRVAMPAATGVAATDTANAVATISSVAGTPAKIMWGAGTYSINQTLTWEHSWEGCGEDATVIQLATGSNCDLIDSYQFSSLTGTSNGGGIEGLSIEGLTIDGNGANQTAGPSWPIRIYCYAYRLENLNIKNGYSGGAWSEWTQGSFSTEYMEAAWKNVRVSDYIGPSSGSGYGVYFAGPHDTKMSDCTISTLKAAEGSAQQNATIYGLYLGGPTGGLQCTNLHVWGRNHYCVYNAISDNWFTGCEAEGAFTANVMMGAGCSWVGGSIYGTNGNNGTQSDEVGFQIGASGIACFTASIIGVRIYNFVNVVVPTGLTATLSSGGSFAGSIQYYWKVTSVDARGETVGSNEYTTTPGSGQQVMLSWTAVTGAVSYNVYRSTTSGGESTSPALVANSTSASYTDTGSATTTGACPSVTTTGGRAINFVNDTGTNMIMAVANTVPTAVSTGTYPTTDYLAVLCSGSPTSGLFQSPQLSAPGASATVYVPVQQSISSVSINGSTVTITTSSALSNIVNGNQVYVSGITGVSSSTPYTVASVSGSSFNITQASASWTSGGTVTQSSFTWSKPAGSTTVTATCVGAGGGGQAGSLQASGTISVGGSGGGGGGFSRNVVPASSLGSLIVTVGIGGAGGLANTTNSSTGPIGSAGLGSSTMAGVCNAQPGSGGAQLSGGASGLGDSVTGGAGVAALNTGLVASNPSDPAQTGSGGAGGGITAATAAANGSKGSHGGGDVNAAGIAGVASTSAGGAGGTGTTAYNGGGGGGGGGANASGNGYNGGAGGNYGAGGGGGGAALNNSTSGAGGAGGSGVVVIMTA
jgi:hypothetical protein